MVAPPQRGALHCRRLCLADLTAGDEAVRVPETEGGADACGFGDALAPSTMYPVVRLMLRLTSVDRERPFLYRLTSLHLPTIDKEEDADAPGGWPAPEPWASARPGRAAAVAAHILSLATAAPSLSSLSVSSAMASARPLALVPAVPSAVRPSWLAWGGLWQLSLCLTPGGKRLGDGLTVLQAIPRHAPALTHLSFRCHWPELLDAGMVAAVAGSLQRLTSLDTSGCPGVAFTPASLVLAACPGRLRRLRANVAPTPTDAESIGWALAWAPLHRSLEEVALWCRPQAESSVVINALAGLAATCPLVSHIQIDNGSRAGSETLGAALWALRPTLASLCLSREASVGSLFPPSASATVGTRTVCVLPQPPTPAVAAGPSPWQRLHTLRLDSLGTTLTDAVFVAALGGTVGTSASAATGVDGRAGTVPPPGLARVGPAPLGCGGSDGGQLPALTCLAITVAPVLGAAGLDAMAAHPRLREIRLKRLGEVAMRSKGPRKALTNALKARKAVKGGASSSRKDSHGISLTLSLAALR